MLMKILSGLRRLTEAREEFLIEIKRIEGVKEGATIRITSRYVTRVPAIEKHYQDLYERLLRNGVSGIDLEFGTLNCWLGLATGHEEAQQYVIALELSFERMPEIPLKRSWRADLARVFPEEAVNWRLVEELAAAA